MRCLEFTLAIICFQPENFYSSWKSFRGVLLSAMGIISIVGVVSLTIEATMDFLSLSSSLPELAILLVTVQWWVTPKGDVLRTVM